ncbi:hypothetical protein LWI28_024341 [Acer negundo]|uniref:Uncharacterized protein n=1 Tax=Acer negundo TaxID=4023 RepID=A0AAD5NM75_ACENE|nr:hypothetical protein LWI28_024341 [Acer negundo]
MDSRRLVFGEVNSITDCSNRSEVLLVVDHDGFLHDHNCCLESHRLADSISLQNMLKMVSGLVTNPSPKQQSASSSNLTLSHFKRRESPESVEQISPLDAIGEFDFAGCFCHLTFLASLMLRKEDGTCIDRYVEVNIDLPRVGRYVEKEEEKRKKKKEKKERRGKFVFFVFCGISEELSRFPSRFLGQSIYIFYTGEFTESTYIFW